jgi:hypothetical protein
MRAGVMRRDLWETLQESLSVTVGTQIPGQGFSNRGDFHL